MTSGNRSLTETTDLTKRKPKPSVVLAGMRTVQRPGANRQNLYDEKITRITLPTCRAHYPGGPGRVMVITGAFTRGLLRLHSNSAVGWSHPTPPDIPTGALPELRQSGGSSPGADLWDRARL